MITAIVLYKLPPHIDLAAACQAHFRGIARGFRAAPGLIRKQFIYAEDGWPEASTCGRPGRRPRRSTAGRG